MTMKSSIYYNKAKEVFEEIQTCFSNLTMIIDQTPENVGLSMDIPKQDGLDIELIELLFKARMEAYFSEYNFVEIGKEKK